MGERCKNAGKKKGEIELRRRGYRIEAWRTRKKRKGKEEERKEREEKGNGRKEKKPL